MAALVAGALLAGSRLWANASTLTTANASAFAGAAADSISKRGKSVVGDKTILDALVPVSEALGTSSSASEALDRAIAAAERAIAETTSMQSRRGRASWLQERSIGLQDPGATALLRFLESWKAANLAD
jgi:dihydroxyacetone kinase-like protein